MKRLLPLYCVVLMGYLAYSMIIPIFSVAILTHDVESIKTQTIFLGILLMMYPIGQFLGGPILGACSDRFGRKPILVFSLLIATIMYFWIALGLSFSWHGVTLIALFITGFCESNVIIAQSAVADVSDKEHRPQRFGYIFVATSSAYIIGPLIAGQLASGHKSGWLNFATPFYFVALILLATFFWVVFKFSETHHEDNRVQVPFLGAVSNIKHVFLEKKLRPYYLIGFLFALVCFTFFRTFPMYFIRTFHIGVRELSDYVAIGALPILLVNFFCIKPLLKYFHPKHVAIVANCILGVSIFAFTLIASTIWMLAWAILACASFAAGGTMLITIISTSISKKRQGRVMGNYLSAQLGAQAIGAFIGQLLAVIFLQLPFYLMGILAIFNAYLIYRLKPIPMDAEEEAVV